MLEHYWDRDWNTSVSHRSQFEYLGYRALSDRLIFIDDSYLQIHLGPERTARVVRDAVAKTGRFPVLCLDSNPYPMERHYAEICQHLDSKSFFCFHPDIRPELSTQPNVAPWPSWPFFQRMEKNYQQDRPKTRRVSFLSGSGRYHRIQLFYDIRPYITPKDVIVINKIGNFEKSVPRSALSPGQIAQWWHDLPYANNKEFYDYTGTGIDDPPQGQQFNSHPAFEACVNITGETCWDDQVLLSEKTWKAYRSGCLVINFGPANSTDALRNLGFEIWDQYDQTGTHKHKTGLIIELMKRDDIHQLYQQNLPMVQHNVELYNSDAFLKKFAQMAIDKLENLILA
jgi:hypothetical protein